MGLKDRIVKAYNAISGKEQKQEEEYDFGMISDVNEMDEVTSEQSKILLSQLDTEMRKFISSGSEKLNDIALPPKVIPLHFLTDTPTATQVITLLGMLRWAMEQSASDGKEYRVSVSIKNRNSSPFLIGMGDVSIPKVAIQEKFTVGD